MSEVISFRLNKDNPREAKALRVLKSWQDEGHNTRHIVTEALLKLMYSDANELKSLVLVELNEKLSIVSQILEQVDCERFLELTASCSTSLGPKLPDSFIESIKKTIKPGIKTD